MVATSSSSNNNKYLGFSSRLTDKLAKCRGEVEQWVDREKKLANGMEETYQQTLLNEQSAIDTLEEQLLSVQFQLGINIKENQHPNQQQQQQHEKNTSSPKIGIAQRQQRLLEEQQRLQSDIARLKEEKQERDQRIKGKTHETV
jgi:hypothetical protein